MIFGFIRRNLTFAATNPRAVPAVRKAMRDHLAANPSCAFCGRVNSPEVHHIVPVARRPDMAASRDNLLTLCGRGRCHLVVGHFGNWNTYNPIARDVCRLARIAR